MQSCDGLDETKIAERYYLIALDYSLVKTNLSYKLKDNNYIGIIESAVFAVGVDGNYIIAKQHPQINSSTINKDVTNYFIVTIFKQDTLSPEKGVRGPFSLAEFKQERERLNISSIEFTTVIKEIE